MPHIEPFRGVFYDTDTAGPIDALIAPPYDKVSGAHKQVLLARSPYNAVRLELPERDDDPQWTVHAAEHLAVWFARGALDRDDEPAYYVYEQEFSHAGARRRRWGFLAVVRLSDEDVAAIRPHEKTFAEIKAERLALMRAVRANLSPIFVLYSDPEGKVRSAFESGTGRTLFSATDDDGTLHRIVRANDLPVLKEVQRGIKRAEMVIADGHHRFETAVAYRNEQRAAAPTDPPGAPYNFVMAYLTPVESEDLVILPAHRAIRLPQGRTMADLAGLVDQGFTCRACPSVGALDRALAEEEGCRVGLVTADRCELLEPKPGAVDAAVEPEASPARRALPVVALHALLVDPLLGPASLEEHVSFHRVAEEAADLVRRGERDAAFLWRATRPADVFAVVNEGERMPQKSTDFYPKVATGLVFNVF